MIKEEKMLKRLADNQSRMILQFTIDKNKTAEDISNKLEIPLSTTYRKIKELKEAGLLIVEKSVITKAGEIRNLYRSTIKGVEIYLNSRPISLNITFNEDVYDKILRAWSSLGTTS